MPAVRCRRHLCNGHISLTTFPEWTIDPLSPGSQYSGPVAGQSNKCQCSTVVFSMVAACGACQAGSVARCVRPALAPHCSFTFDIAGTHGKQIVHRVIYPLDRKYHIVSSSAPDSQFCTAIRFPVGIPSGISVPSWAYLNVTVRVHFPFLSTTTQTTFPTDVRRLGSHCRIEQP